MKALKEYLLPVFVFIGILFLGVWYFSTSQTQPHTAETNAGFTCSMHPEVHSHEDGQCPICGMNLIPVKKVVQQDSLPSGMLNMSREDMESAHIAASYPRIEPGQITLYLNGRLDYDERTTTSESASFPGRIEEIFVTFRGQKIIKDGLIARIYSPTLKQAIQEYVGVKQASSSAGAVSAALERLQWFDLAELDVQPFVNGAPIPASFELRAKHSGITTAINKRVGDYVEVGEHIYSLASKNKAWVWLDIFPQQRSLINLGDKVLLTLSDGQNLGTFPIDFIDTQTDVAGNAKARISLQTSEAIPFGSWIQGRSTAFTEENLLLADKESVLWTGPRSLVWKMYEGGDSPHFEPIEVEIGREFSNGFEIKSGISRSDMVVNRGIFQLDAAAQLAGNRSMMNTTPRSNSGNSMGGMKM